MLTLKVINLFAGPGTGKSTTAAGLFNLMKHLGYSVELVTEFAKDVTYEKNYGYLTNQLYLLAEQDKRLRRLEGQVEWAITDSPLPLGLAYMTPEYEDWLPAAMWGAYGRYENFHVLLHRDPEVPFDPTGWNQKTLLEASKLDNVIDSLYAEAAEDDEDFSMELKATVKAPYKILDWLVAGEELPAAQDEWGQGYREELR